MKAQAASTPAHSPHLIPTASARSMAAPKTPTIQLLHQHLPRVCTQGGGRKTYLAMRLLTAFSLLPHSSKCGVGFFCLFLIVQLAYKRVRFIKTYPWKQRHSVLSISSGTIIWYQYTASFLYSFHPWNKPTVTATQCIIFPCKATQPHNNPPLPIMSSNSNEKNLGLKKKKKLQQETRL